MDEDNSSTPFLFGETVNKWLEAALDSGILEDRFWMMTYAEITREIESKQRMHRVDAKEKASFDYLLADLIGRSVARTQSNKNKYPPIDEVYPSLFTVDEVEENQITKQDELSALRFKQFAASFNHRIRGEAKINE